ncbi:MAG: DNA gyrase subunit A [bacterium]|nr:DNA gyrase subunit A [bacterium]MDZ4284686.1 DNA gyrase subunit A [Patescibacteria group bacterium]
MDGDPAAAMRYSEAKMARLSAELLRDLEKETTDWRPNYDATRREPVVLPAALPNLLLNGTLGIAVGMATNIPPHNLGEVAAALAHLIDNPEATTEEMLEYIKGPDFPIGAVLYGTRDLHHAYATGRGGVVVRGEAEITEGKDGTTQIIITSIPYRTNKADLMESIAALVRDKKLEGIKELRDESTKDIRVVVGLKGTAQPKQVLNFIYKHTGLEDTFHFNMVALDEGVPRTFSLKGMLEKFVEHRIDVVERRSRFDLARSEEREHILLGLKKALDQIDKIIKTIRGSRDVTGAHTALMREFRFSDRQATAILEMRLQKLAGLERKKVEEELLAVEKLIADLRALLVSPKRIRGVIKTELAEVAAKYGDERRTRIVRHGVKEMTDEDLIPDEESVLVLTRGGYVKRTNPSEYRRQRRGGVGVIDMNTKEEDFVTTLLTGSTLSDILFFTNRGKVYQTKMYDVPEGRKATRGKSIMNFLPLSQGEEVSSVLVMLSERRAEEALSVMMVTRQGRVKRVAAKSFHEVRRSGLIAITIPADDQLVSTFFVGRGDDAIIATAAGQAIRFKASTVREMGRAAAGVRGMRLAKGDSVVGADSVRSTLEAPALLVVSEKGFGKRTALKEYKVQGRGGGGIKTLKVSAKTGRLIRAGVVEESEAEVVAISKRGQVIRLALREIPLLGRATQGVRIMKLREGDAIASTVCL